MWYMKLWYTYTNFFLEMTTLIKNYLKMSDQILEKASDQYTQKSVPPKFSTVPNDT